MTRVVPLRLVEPAAIGVKNGACVMLSFNGRRRVKMTMLRLGWSSRGKEGFSQGLEEGLWRAEISKVLHLPFAWEQGKKRACVLVLEKSRLRSLRERLSAPRSLHIAHQRAATHAWSTSNPTSSYHHSFP